MLIGYKYVNYLIWKEIYLKVKSKAHLTQEGINQIKELRLKLNKYSVEEVDYNDTCLSHETSITTLKLNKKYYKNKGPKGSRSSSTSTKSQGNVNIPKAIVVGANSKLSPYLAGLIEADGSIAVHDKDSKVKKYRPQIIVVFSLADKPLAEKLAVLTQVGTVTIKKVQDAYYGKFRKKKT